MAAMPAGPPPPPPPAVAIHLNIAQPALPAPVPTAADLGRWTTYLQELIQYRALGVTESEIGQAHAYVSLLCQLHAGPPPWLPNALAAANAAGAAGAAGAAVPAWFQPAMATALTTALAPVLASLAASQTNIAKLHNASVIGMHGKPLLPPNNAAGQPPPVGFFPPDTDVLRAWGQTTSTALALWNRVHRLLQHFNVVDPHSGQQFVQPHPAPLPLRPPHHVAAELRRRVAVLIEAIRT